MRKKEAKRKCDGPRGGVLIKRRGGGLGGRVYNRQGTPGGGKFQKLKDREWKPGSGISTGASREGSQSFHCQGGGLGIPAGNGGKKLEGISRNQCGAKKMEKRFADKDFKTAR